MTWCGVLAGWVLTLRAQKFFLKMRFFFFFGFSEGLQNFPKNLVRRTRPFFARYFFIFMNKNRLTKKAYAEEIKKERKNSWAKQTKKTLKLYGLKKYWESQFPPARQSKWNNIVENSIKKKEEQSWNLERRRKQTKLETYN